MHKTANDCKQLLTNVFLEGLFVLIDFVSQPASCFMLFKRKTTAINTAPKTMHG